jgi:hypothetical protein
MNLIINYIINKLWNNNRNFKIDKIKMILILCNISCRKLKIQIIHSVHLKNKHKKTGKKFKML